MYSYQKIIIMIKHSYLILVDIKITALPPPANECQHQEDEAAQNTDEDTNSNGNE